MKMESHLMSIGVVTEKKKTMPSQTIHPTMHPINNPAMLDSISVAYMYQITVKITLGEFANIPNVSVLYKLKKKDAKRFPQEETHSLQQGSYLVSKEQDRCQWCAFTFWEYCSGGKSGIC